MNGGPFIFPVLGKCVTDSPLARLWEPAVWQDATSWPAKQASNQTTGQPTKQPANQLICLPAAHQANHLAIQPVGQPINQSAN